MDGHKGLRLVGWVTGRKRREEGGDGDWVANRRRWVVVALAYDAGCGKEADIGPMR